ncbi:tetratricopeptide repeat protein [Burkholderia plantarii]|uniref:tetratricopeptide repeat protein n=1 Tax=Burkholderia plantarii TaxID=41899 RepID=UPI00272D4CC9|nr:tetratricopeptide repeat protein [Burkholderia plantarii]WLE59066.1 tetratricopeptide repeat protein [Burkholderia plantarii]
MDLQSGPQATPPEAERRSGSARYGTAMGGGREPAPDYASAAALEQIATGHRLCLEGRYADAEACFRIAVESEPDWPMAHNNLGWSLQAQGRNEDALLSYQKAVQLAPAFVLARANLAYLLANLYWHVGRFEEARAMWRVLAALYPCDPEVLDNLVSAALRVNDLTDAGHWATRHAAVTRASPYHPMPAAAPDLPMPEPRLSRGKLRHDLEQLRYLRDEGQLDESFDAVIACYAQTLERFNEGDAALRQALYDAPEMKSTYGRIVHCHPAARVPGGALSETAMHSQAEQAYLASRLGIVVIDDFLSPQALSALRRFCLESTVWHANRYAYDRLGAFFRDGFNCPLLLQIAEEIRQAFPNLIGEHHPLLQLWGFKYRHDQPATHPHADFAAVNVNFWITPDEANQDEQSGGLVIYDVEAPVDWDFDAYNRQGDRISAFLQEAGAQRIVIPYRCNRAIIFNSDLFHATAPLRFRAGYADRRINVTMLYGERNRTAAP